MLKRLLILALVASGCAGSPASEVCATGSICPSGTQCAAVQAVCITNDCGDGIVQSTEKCDDGNIMDGDGCSRDCQSTEACGNGVTDTNAGEVCDDGNTNAGDGCAANCRSLEQCGDGIKDTAKGEVCDDGNTVSGDGCAANCKSTEICGNGIQDVDERC